MAEEARKTAAAALKEKIKDLRRYNEKPAASASARLLQQKYDQVVAAQEDLMTRHYTYCEKSKKDPEDEEMTEWLSEKTKDVADLLDEVFVKLEKAETESNAAEVQSQKDALTLIEEAKKLNNLNVATAQSDADEKLLREQVQSMKVVVDDKEKNTASDATTVQSMLKEVEVTQENLIKSWNTVKSLCGSVQLASTVDKEKNLNKFIAENRSAANAFISEVKPALVSKPSSSSDGSNWKVEKVGLPKFSGNSRTYARFKGDFDKIVGKNYPDILYRTYILKNNCLAGEAKSLVENIEDMDEIWTRLDSKYGNDREIINMVLNEVKKLELQKGDWDTSLIKLVDVLEKGCLLYTSPRPRDS